MVSTEPDTKETETKQYDTIQITVLLRIVRFFFAFLSQILVTACLQFLAPSFAVHMQRYGFSPAFIGLCFAVPGIIYAALSPLMYLMTERLRKRAVIILGIFLMSFGMFCVGTSKYFGLENNPALIMFGLMVIGVSAGMISIPVLPEMLEAIEQTPEVNYNAEELENYISGVFVICTGLGEAIGPTLSSTLNEAYGFRIAQDIFAGFCLLLALVYFCSVGHFRLCYRRRKRKPIEAGSKSF